MARRRRADKRQIPPDPRYRNVELGQFINKVMLNGKKTVAQRLVYDALEQAQNESRRQGLEVFEQAIRNASPMLEVKSRRVGGATYQVPTDVRTGATTGAFDALDSQRGARQNRKAYGRATGPRVAGRIQRTGRRCEAKGRVVSDGGGKQGVRPLPLVTKRRKAVSGLRSA